MATKKELWDAFQKKHNFKYHYVILLTKEYAKKCEELGITSKSSEAKKRKAAIYPVLMVQIGQDEKKDTFNCSFFTGNDGPKLEKSGFTTPDEAYDFITKQASVVNKSI